MCCATRDHLGRTPLGWQVSLHFVTSDRHAGATASGDTEPEPGAEPGPEPGPEPGQGPEPESAATAGVICLGAAGRGGGVSVLSPHRHTPLHPAVIHPLTTVLHLSMYL